ncbi:choline binding-anchored murein hydrolase LytC [Streptococcus pseudopneumoniae]|uniref:choline binding-anchored murein hydrolase LytC n=1 Tax=Streptococcus pseudopneumoniae TaxID=257758 RepID=UPI00040BBEEB|nr:choline binding-anchored murein hydrolase LytC [Streptococcus pseudopneumoniae]
MSVPFFIGEERLKTKFVCIGLASLCLLGVRVSGIAADETSGSTVSEKSSLSTGTSSTSSNEQRNSVSAHWDGDYYVKADGSKAQSEWIFDNNYKAWFYLKSDGRYVQNEWQGNYYLKSGGYMAQNEWLYDNNYKSWFYLKSDGAYAHQEWQLIGNKWYYFKKWGYMARNEWQGNYYLTGSGAMATDEVIMDGARYIFAASGELKEKKDLNVGWVHRDGKRYFFNNREEQVGTEHAKKVIDISEHNGRINDWKKVIDENEVDGVIVRLGYSGKEDKELAHNIKELNRLGIPYGVYLYTYAENETDAENDAEQTIELLKKYNMNLSYPIYYDVENWEYVNKSKRAPNDTGTWVKIINKYMETMKQAGYQNVYVYSYRSLLQTRLKHPDILKHVNWVAAYNNALEWENPHYSGEKGWQYTSSEYMKGIQGRVDVSVWY